MAVARQTKSRVQLRLAESETRMMAAAGGAEGADGAEEDSGEPDRDRHPASGSALEGFDRTVGGEELLPATAAAREVLTQLLRGQDLRVQLPTRDPPPVADENERQADEGEHAQADVQIQLRTQRADICSGGGDIRPFGGDDGQEQQHPEEQGDAGPDESPDDRMAVGARGHGSTLPARDGRDRHPKG
jgi:hypothetical protein